MMLQFGPRPSEPMPRRAVVSRLHALGTYRAQRARSVRGHATEWSAGAPYDPVALSAAGCTVDDGGRFVDGAAPREGQRDCGFRPARSDRDTRLASLRSVVRKGA